MTPAVNRCALYWIYLNKYIYIDLDRAFSGRLLTTSNAAFGHSVK